MNRNQILVIIVIILLAINTISHISSPVYKFYKENIARIDKSNEQFRNEIKVLYMTEESKDQKIDEAVEE